MKKTEAAEILATNIAVWHRKADEDDSDMKWLCDRARLRIAEAVSRGIWESVPGSYLNEAAKVRPSDRTVVTAYKRRAGLL